jgi:polyhydroxybutyrate depolymerase
MGFWIGENNCLDTTTIELPDIDTTDNSTVTKSIYSPCNENVEVILYTINGGGHTWPGAPIDIGGTNYDIEASVEIWNFLKRYTLPETVDVTGNQFSHEKLLIYPQPVVNAAVIKVPTEVDQIWNLKLMDISGRVIRNEIAGFGKQVSFVRKGLKPGIYIIEITSENRSFREKIILK